MTTGPEGDDPRPMTIKNVPSRVRSMFVQGAETHRETMAQYLDRALLAAQGATPDYTGPVQATGALYTTDLRAAALGRLHTLAFAVKELISADAMADAYSPGSKAIPMMTGANARAVRAAVGEILREARGMPPLKPRLRGAVLNATQGDQTPLSEGDAT